MADPFVKLNSKIPPNASVSNQAVSLTGNTIVAGRDHLGWQRRPEDAAGRWIYRRRRSGDYSTELIGTADDRDEADGVSILDFQQARAKAVELSLDEGRPGRRITVSRAIADYIDYLSASGKLTSTAESAAVTWILPKLGHCEVAASTSQQLRSWVAWMAENGGDEEQIAAVVLQQIAT